MPNVTLDEAREVHDRMLVVDGHTDTPVEHIARGEDIDWENRDPAYHMDIPRCKEGGYDAGFFIVGDGLVADVRVTLQQTLESVEWFPESIFDSGCLIMNYEKLGAPSPIHPIPEIG